MTASDVDARFREIIHRQEGKPPVDEPWQVFVPEAGVWGALPGRLARGYLVSRPHQGRGIVAGTVSFPLHAPEQEWRLTLDVAYEASVSREERDPRTVAAKVVAALGASDRPGTTFENRLEDMIQHCVRQEGGAAQVLPRLAAFRARLKAEVRKRMALELGLDVALTSVAPTGGIPEHDHAFTRNVTFHAADYSAVELTAQVQIETATAGSLAHVYRDRFTALQDQLVARARDQLQRRTLQELESDLGAVERDIRARLDRLAARHGRRIKRFALVYRHIVDRTSQSVRIAPFAITFDKGVDYPREVRVECELHLTRTDAGAYVRAGQPKLQPWAEAACRVAVEETLLNVSYVDLFLGREPQGETGFVRYDLRVAQTKASIRARAARIGYEADTVVIRTDLDFVELRDGFRIELTGGSFPMADPLHEAKLDVEVRARIHTEGAIRALFDRGTNIKGELKERIRDTVQSFMKDTNPDDYYIYFADEAQRATAGHNVLSSLRDRVRAMLKERYEADRIAISCTPRQTIFEERFRELMQGNHELALVVTHSALTYACMYRVKLVSRLHWREFRDRLPTLEQVHAVTAASLSQWLNDQPRDELLATSNHALRNILNDSKSIALAPVVHELGLLVQIMAIQRSLDEEADARLTIVREGRIAEAQDLEHQRLERMRALDQRVVTLRRLAEQAVKAGDFDEARALDGMAENAAAERERARQQSIYRSATKALEESAAASGGPASNGAGDRTLGGATDEARGHLGDGRS